MNKHLVVLLISLLIISACKTQASPIENYKQARHVFWNKLYPYKATTLYCEETVDSGYRKGFNIEHIFPMSWVTKSLSCGKRKQCRRNSKQFNLIEADLHNLYPSRSDVNAARSSFAFAEVRGEKRNFGKQCDFEVDKKRRIAEPSPQRRGEVARAMFYMAQRYNEYGLKLFSKQKKLLYQWHIDDLPSEAEKKRNNKIEQLQGNRNPFVDDVKLADKYYR